MSQSLALALEHHEAGRLTEAAEIYREILRAEPTNPDALHFLGLVALQSGRHRDAIDLIERAHRHGRAHASSLNHLGMAYRASNRPRDAKRCFTKAIALKPDDAGAHCNLGNALKDLGRPLEAERSYRRSLALDPRAAEAHYNLGNLLLALARTDEAAEAYRQAIGCRADHAPAHNNLGIALAAGRRWEEAERSYREALRFDPSYKEAHHNLGKTLEKLRRFEEAERSYRDALALQPDLVETRINLGNVLQELKRYDEAIECLHQVLTAKPELAEAHFNLGNILIALDRQPEALSAYRRSLELRPDFAAARWAFAMAQLPGVYEGEGDPDRCRAAFAEQLGRLADWFDTRRDEHDPDAIVRQPFYLAYQDQDNRDLLARYGRLSAEVMQRWLERQRFPRVPPPKRGVIRVGIVSAHVFEHSVWTALVRGWLQRLDRGRLEVDVFYLNPKEDQETLAARAHASHFEHGPKDLREWVQAILDRQPNVLIYPEIGMETMTGKLASLRLAPVQIAAWGHPETSGLPTMDYYLSAEAFEPPGAERHYTERLVALPGLGCYYEETPVTAVTPDLARLGLDAGSPILLCPGTPFKYAPEHDRVFPRIVRGLGRCQLVFFTHQAAHLSAKLRRRLKAVFERDGLEFERYVAFVPWLPRAEFYGLMKRADALLDTIGFSGFNTAMQAVECGLPIVTREGRFMRGRLASGILKRLGLSEWVAESEEQYVAMAIKLARDSEERLRVRTHMAGVRDTLYRDINPVAKLGDFLST